MSQMESQYGAQMVDPMQGGSPPQTTSGLAVASLICSLIFCCPLTTIPAIIMGLIATITVSANPLKKGRGFAIAAVLIGVIATGAQVAGFAWVYSTFWKPIVEGPVAAMNAVSTGDLTAFRNEFHGAGATASDAEVTSFFNELTLRYGAFQSMTLDERSMGQPAPGQTSLVVPYVAVFANGTVTLEAERIWVDSTGGSLINLWGYIAIIDPDEGDLTYPPAAGSGRSSATGAGNGASNADADQDSGD